MSNPTPPDGWDQIPQDMLDAGAAMRQIYISLIASGFSMIEAATIIGAVLASGQSINPTPPAGS